MTSSLSIFQNVIFLAKNILKMEDQICYIWAFLDWNSQKLLHCDILHQHPEIFPNTTFRPNMKILKFENKIVLIWYIGYFGLEFQKTDVIFEISTLEFVNMQRFIQKQKIFKIGTKNTSRRYFWAAI